MELVGGLVHLLIDVWHWLTNANAHVRWWDLWSVCWPPIAITDMYRG